MLQLKKRLLFASTIVSLTGIVAAAYASPGWSGFGTVKNVEVDGASWASNGTATYVWFTNAVSGAPACQSSNPQYLAVGSPDHVRQVTALASQALLSGKQFQVHFNGTCTDEKGGLIVPLPGAPNIPKGYANFDSASIGWQ